MNKYLKPEGTPSGYPCEEHMVEKTSTQKPSSKF